MSKVYSTKFVPYSAALKTEDAESCFYEWAQRVGRQGDIITGYDDILNWGSLYKLVHELPE